MKINILGAHCAELVADNVTVLFSYQTPVAAIIDGLYYKTDFKWSTTTSMHINSFLQNHNAIVKPQKFFSNVELKFLENKNGFI